MSWSLKRKTPSVEVVANVFATPPPLSHRDPYKVWLASLREEDRAVLRYAKRFNIDDLFRIYDIASEERAHGGPARINDVLWSILTKDCEQSFITMQAHWTSCRMIAMGDLLASEERHAPALEQYLAAAFFEANSCSNVSLYVREVYPEIAGLPFGQRPAPPPRLNLTSRMLLVMRSGDIGMDEARTIMLEIGAAWFYGNEHLGMNASPEQAWQWIAAGLKEAQAVVKPVRKRRSKSPPIIPDDLRLPDYPG